MSRGSIALCVALAACGRVGFEPATDASLTDAAIAPNAVAQIAPGGFTTCALLGSGDVYCWGRGGGGLLADGNTDTHSSSVPTRVALPPVIAIDNADGGTIVWDADGTAYAWGFNLFGWLGTPGTQATPVVLPVDDVIAAAHTINGACVLRRDHSVWCAGTATTLGDGSAVERATYAPAAISDVRSLTAGDDFFCAQRMAGDVWCWGENEWGQYGNNSFAPSGVPVPGPGAYDKITLGDEFGCGLTDGMVECWGNNTYGQLGDGQSATMRATAVRVPGLTDVVDFAAGAEWTCAMRGSGDVVCWGNNNVRAVGEPMATPFTTGPGRTILESAMTIRARTGVHNCALTRDRVPLCWGENADGELGRPGGPATEVPMPVEGLP